MRVGIVHADIVKGRQIVMFSIVMSRFGASSVYHICGSFLQVGLNCENLAEKWAQRESTHDN